MDEWSEGAQDDFLKRVVEGLVIPEILAQPGTPPLNIVLGWMQEKGFLKKYDAAKKLRAEMFHDQAIQVSKNTVKETAAADKLQVDTLKWAAAIANGSTYGLKNKITSEGDGVIIVSTGILRPEDPDFNQEEFDATISRHRVQAKETPKGTPLASEKV